MRRVLTDEKKTKRRREMSEKSCCNFEITNLENGFRIEVTGSDCQEFMKKFLENCCKGKEGSKDCCS